MNRWLLKTEPGTYSWDDLFREGRTAWTGVANPQAQLNLKAMAEGDLAAIYHTGGEKAAVGIAQVVRAAYPEPGSDKLVCVDLAPDAPLANPVTLERLKAEKAFARSALVKQGRLSVVALDATQWKVLVGLARKPAAAVRAMRARGSRSTPHLRKAHENR